MKLSKLPLLLSSVLLSGSLAVPYEQYILAPKSRTLTPVSIHSSNGTVSSPENLLSGSTSNSSATYSGTSATAFDFGINIAGFVSLDIASVSDADQYIGVTFSESSLWISNASSDATADAGKDETLWFHVTGPGRYTAPREKERGAFRYMTLVHNIVGSVEVANAEVHYTAMPHWKDSELGAYTGFFNCDDELLNRIWYAGAYTNQICTIDPNYGNALIHLGTINSSVSDAVNVTWYNNGTITNGTSALVDGAKRDRIVWAGDMAIAVPAVVVSTNDVVSIENSLNSLFDIQKPTGQLPYAGRPFFDVLSFTYHLYTLIGVADHYLYTGNITYLSSLWDKYKEALNFSLSSIDSSGLMNVTSPPDWLRFGMGGHNIEANAILYYTLNQALDLAHALNDTTHTANWTATAARLKSAANALLWDASAGLYRDNETTTLHPQDGNSWAIVANLTQNTTQAQLISAALAARWTPFGAPAPEAADAISPFITSFELQAHFAARNASAALALVRTQWGFMLDDPRMTNSTFIEGYSASGALHYAPYSNDARISHAHGWATGPTSSLTLHVAGLRVLSAGGKTWVVAPALGDLRWAHAGFRTAVGAFEAETRVGKGGAWTLAFETPRGTVGGVRFPVAGCRGTVTMVAEGGEAEVIVVAVEAGERAPEVEGVAGGKWKARLVCGCD